MIRLITLTSLLFCFSFGHADVTQRKVELENQIHDRVFAVVKGVDPFAIVQVTVNLKTVASDLPAMALAGSVTPVEFDGNLGVSSIQSISVRVISQLEKMPDWIKKEVEVSAKFDKAHVSVAYEKAGGTITDSRSEFPKLGRLTVDTAVEGFKQIQFGLFGLIGVVLLALGFIGFAVISMAGRMEKSMSRLIEEKVVPALAERGGGSQQAAARSESDKPVTVSMEGGGGAGGSKELADFPDETLLTLFADCYWTQADGYAHYLWNQMSQAQREMVMAKRVVEQSYFWHILEADPVKQDYHLDARYLILGSEFRMLSQEDLLGWTKRNPKLTHRITPMRWDDLQLTLQERLEYMSEQGVRSGQPELAVKVDTKSKPREIPATLRLRTIRPEDEEFVWQNPDKVPHTSRKALRSLVWLALCEETYRRDVLNEMDAREIASAWVGPEEVLKRLQDVIAPKKFEMVTHFRNTTQASREAEAFQFLCDAGIRGLTAQAAATETGAKAA